MHSNGGRVDDWFDTSATKLLRSPSASRGGREVAKSAEGGEGARGALVDVTNSGNGGEVGGVRGLATTKPPTRALAVHKPVTRSAEATQESNRKKDAEHQIRPKAPAEDGRREDQREEERREDQREERPRVVAAKPAHRGRHLTVPKSPMLLSRLRSGGRQRLVKSSEELEMERIEQEKKSAREKKRKGQSGGAAAPLDHALQDQARKRAKTAGQAARAAGVAPGGFTVGSGQVGPVGQGGQANKRRNPPRSRKQKLTMPQSPAFATNGRVRAPRFKSTEELQLEEIAKFRLAKAGAVGKKQGGSCERPTRLVIPTGSGSGPGRGRGAKSTTAARASKALAATRSAPQTTQAMPRGSQAARSFGEGPITRSRAHVVETTKTKQVPRSAPVLRLGGARRVVLQQADGGDAAVGSGDSDALSPAMAAARADRSLPTDPPTTRSILDRITAGSLRREEHGHGGNESPTTTFAQLSRRDKFHNPLFEFKQGDRR